MDGLKAMWIDGRPCGWIEGHVDRWKGMWMDLRPCGWIEGHVDFPIHKELSEWLW